MAKKGPLGINSATWFALICLFVAVGLLPVLKAAAPYYFPEGFNTGNNQSCVGVSCVEGEFCQNGGCKKIFVGNPGGEVPTGNI